MDARHASGLFTIQGGLIFLVAVTKDDGLPAYVCRSCRGKASSVEKRLKDLQKLKNFVMDRIAESIPRRLAAVQLSLLNWLQLVLQLNNQTCLVKKFFRKVVA